MKWWHDADVKSEREKLRRSLYLPPGYDADPNARWPLLLFLHGSGERGDDLNRVGWHGPQKHIDAGHPQPMLVLSPQCPAAGWWNPWELNALLDEVCATHRVDPDRIYVTGLSMGGFGAWHLAAEFPERFAAVVPICGKGGVGDAARLKEIPIWNFHGKLDGAVPVKCSEDMVKALAEVKGRIRFTLFSNLGHDCWTTAYNDPTLYEWLLKQKRGAPNQPHAGSMEQATTTFEKK